MFYKDFNVILTGTDLYTLLTGVPPENISLVKDLGLTSEAIDICKAGKPQYSYINGKKVLENPNTIAKLFCEAINYFVENGILDIVIHLYQYLSNDYRLTDDSLNKFKAGLNNTTAYSPDDLNIIDDDIIEEIEFKQITTHIMICKESLGLRN